MTEATERVAMTVRENKQVINITCITQRQGKIKNQNSLPPVPEEHINEIRAQMLTELILNPEKIHSKEENQIC